MAAARPPPADAGERSAAQALRDSLEQSQEAAEQLPASLSLPEKWQDAMVRFFCRHVNPA